MQQHLSIFKAQVTLVSRIMFVYYFLLTRQTFLFLLSAKTTGDQTLKTLA